ncbi:hypothetical protein J6590_056301 [Homalodisca vitripennis]|nr:hypothetical protein J6590_056301 [Homalodisca vitripennis]
MLDLMVLCWCQQPRDRPSASQIVSIASAPEFTHLYDIVSLNHSAAVTATVTAPLSLTEETGTGGEVWLACGNSRADQLVVSGRACVQYSTLSLPDCPTAACLVDGYVWLGDTAGTIHVFRVGDCGHVFSYTLDPADSTCVCALLYLTQQARVAVGLSNGRVFLVRSDASPSSHTMAEGSFVMSELGSSTVLHAITAVYYSSDSGSALYDSKPTYAGEKFLNNLPEALKSISRNLLKKRLTTWLLDQSFYSLEEFLNWREH